MRVSLSQLAPELASQAELSTCFGLDGVWWLGAGGRGQCERKLKGTVLLWSHKERQQHLQTSRDSTHATRTHKQQGQTQADGQEATRWVDTQQGQTHPVGRGATTGGHTRNGGTPTLLAVGRQPVGTHATTQEPTPWARLAPVGVYGEG
jgi:hypothetical protein